MIMHDIINLLQWFTDILLFTISASRIFFWRDMKVASTAANAEYISFLHIPATFIAQMNQQKKSNTYKDINKRNR